MNTIQGTVRNGQIVLDKPQELLDGTRVEVLPIELRQPTCGMREEDWPTTPEGIIELLTWMDRVEPSWLSAADDAAWRSDLCAQNKNEKARFLEDAEKLRRMWD